ncbi:MAG: 50S ribosomal protein L25 [Isosphaeraceae bacterium]|nr:50S ribosomal protein L25 [Isosphaeraceae bacterium]
MAEAVKIKVEARDPQKNKGTGSRVARRLRAEGKVPAVIYGHKQPVVTIALTRDAVHELIKKATHFAELDLGGSSETVLVRDVQWDYLGKEIIHLDFARVSAEESIETEVRLDLRGYVPGAVAGGLLEVVHHTVNVVCPAAAIPDSIKVDVSALQLGQGVHVRDLVLPEGVKVDADPDLLLVHIVARSAAPEPAAGAEGESVTQPEVIKPERKEKEKE